MIVVGIASLAYGVFDIAQANQVLGVVKLLLGIVAVALGAYYLSRRAAR
jgi:hypothetical protein